MCTVTERRKAMTVECTPPSKTRALSYRVLGSTHYRQSRCLGLTSVT